MPKRMDTPPKICAHCAGLYRRKTNELPFAFAKRIYCGYSCSNAARVSVPTKGLLHSRSIPTETGCREWIGHLTDRGYGAIWLGGKLKRAHRVTWEIERGPIPVGLSVCHHCDNRKCINIDHLFLGTHQENMRDAARKQRYNPNRGSQSWFAVLSEADVIQIKASIETRAELAKRFGVSVSTIAAVLSGQNWGHVA